MIERRVNESLPYQSPRLNQCPLYSIHLNKNSCNSASPATRFQENIYPFQVYLVFLTSRAFETGKATVKDSARACPSYPQVETSTAATAAKALFRSNLAGDRSNPSTSSPTVSPWRRASDFITVHGRSFGLRRDSRPLSSIRWLHERLGRVAEEERLRTFSSINSLPL